MRQPLQQTLRDGVRRVQHLFTATGVILLYHRVANAAADPYMLTVSPAHFEEHLAVITEVATTVHLAELSEALRRGKPLRRAVCVTFDDAYQDNLYTAKPLLERHGVPATVFATTGCGRAREFWWDELERIFLSPGRLPVCLELQIEGVAYAWDLGSSADPGPEWSSYTGWSFVDDDVPTKRHATFLAVYELLRPLPDAGRARILDALLMWAGRVSTVRPEFRALDADELVDLEDGGLIRVGAHTVSHPSLPARPVREQSDEISRSRNTLTQWLGHPVASFAYPYGHFSAPSVSAVRDAGFDHACSCLPQPVRRSSDPFTLPRVEVQDWDGETFRRKLRWYFGV